MSIFDPLGLLQHFLVRLKILLQMVWRSKLKWDDQLVSKDHQEYWDSWFKLLPRVEKLEIPRLYASNLSTSTLDLHIFVDASQDAYSAVVFLRIESEQQIKCVLLGSKTRVAPIKYVSTPRLELQAAVLGTRFMNSIEKSQNIKFNRRFIWTDSNTVVSWIRSDHKKYQQFVAHRIGEILENSDQSMWRWLPGKENVADDATKWENTPSFDANCRWFNGPTFLYQPESNWPKEENPIEADTPEEMKIRCLYIRLIPPPMVDPTRFSNWNRMVRALAFVLHFIKVLRAKIYKEKLPRQSLSQDELIKARHLILNQAQYEGYPDEMAILRRNQNLPEDRQRSLLRSSSLYSCSPYLDENNILRIRGRIDAANKISFDQKRPIILPKMNKITSLLVAYYHQNYLHRNHETVINEIRQRFFIPQLRVILKIIRRNCQYCKNLFARPRPPEMGNLPYARLAVGFRMFTYTGIDYFGPIKIIDGRTVKKRWGVVFTCLTTRGIHIEIAHSYDTESCVMCIRNFIVHHGSPREIYSDNGTNFVGANNELSDEAAELDSDKLASAFTSCYTEWKFNPPESPHQGGVWERLIRSIKTSLYDILPDRKPTDEQFKNMLAEIQFVVNSRPLTFIPLEHETDEALTPNHFIFGSSDGSKPIIPPQNNPNLRSKWRENQRIADLFWKRFVKEYLPTLTRRTKWFDQVEPLKVGDLVLIMDTIGTRNTYPRARAIEVIMGSNNQARRIRVQRSDKKILIRSAQKLAKLDVEPSSQEGLAVIPSNNETVGSVTSGGFAKARKN